MSSASRPLPSLPRLPALHPQGPPADRLTRLRTRPLSPIRRFARRLALSRPPVPRPPASRGGGPAVFNNRLYILGGYTWEGSSVTDEIWEFDPNRAPGARWLLRNAHLPQPLGFVPAATIGNYIYTAGGAGSVRGSVESIPDTY